MWNWYQDDHWNMKYWLFVGFLLGILLLYMILYCKMQPFYTTLGVVVEEQVLLVLPAEQLQVLLKHDQIMIEKKNYSYYVVKILDEVQVENGIILKQVLIKVSLPKKMLRNNNTFSVMIPLEEKSLFRMLESCWKEE